jgi:hypothetical protein
MKDFITKDSLLLDGMVMIWARLPGHNYRTIPFKMKLFYILIITTAVIVFFYEFIVNVLSQSTDSQERHKEPDNKVNFSESPNVETSITITEELQNNSGSNIICNYEDICEVLEIIYRKLESKGFSRECFTGLSFKYPKYTQEYLYNLWRYPENNQSLVDDFSNIITYNIFKYIQHKDSKSKEESLEAAIHNLIRYHNDNPIFREKRFFNYEVGIGDRFSILKSKDTRRNTWIFNEANIFAFTEEEIHSFFMDANLGGLLELDFTKDFDNYSKKFGSFMDVFMDSIIRLKLKEVLLENEIDIKSIWIKDYPILKKLILSVGNFYAFTIQPYDETLKTIVNNKTSPFYFLLFFVYTYHFFKSNKNNSIVNNINAWIDANLTIRCCQVCSKKYKTINLDYKVIRRFGEGIYNCCFRCEIVEKPPKEVILQNIPEFVNACRFIPTSNFHPENISFCRKIVDPHSWVNIIKAYAKIGHPHHIIDVVGSWNEALLLSCVVTENQIRGARGIICIAKDGHLCLSLQEQFIDNWLYDNNIPHEKEALYPPHELYNKFGRRRVDWKVGETYIEYFGLIDDSAYFQKTLEKIQLAKHLEITLIPIYPNDIENLGSKLGHLIIE